MTLRTALLIAAGFVLSPPSVAVGSPLPQGYFDVLFYSDKADLTPRGRETINGVSLTPANHGVIFDIIDDAHWRLVSASDRALSDLRAKAVVAQLLADGVPKSLINIYYVDNQHQDPREQLTRRVVVFIPCSPPPPGVIFVP